MSHSEKVLISKNILIADDDPGMLKLYARMFSGKGYSITLAASVAEARCFLETNHYDLLITDLMFPDGLGTELVKLFKERRVDAKCLLVTGSVTELTEAGLSECFDKPLKIDPFMSVVSKALGKVDL